MKSKKNRFLITLLLCAMGCFSAGLFACGGGNGGDGGQSQSGISYDKITFASQTVDVANAPDYIVEIGDNKIVKVLVDGEELDKEDYLVKNGYFAFAYENFQVMGLGTHAVQVVFEQGTKEFTITVTDSQDAKFVISVETSYAIGDTELPKAERLNDYQDFSLSYSLTKSGVDVPMEDKGDTFLVSLAEEGSYVYTVTVVKNGQTTTKEYTLQVEDEFDYEEGKNYVTPDLMNYFSATGGLSWDDTRNAIKANDYLAISNELIQRARYAGDNYLEVTLSTDINNPSYGSFAYKPTDKKQVASLGGEFYATDCLQTIIIDLTAIELTTGETEFAKGNSGLPIWLYSARFLTDSLNDNVNYAAHAYKQAQIWTATDGDGTPWDYRVGDYMELWTYETIIVKRSLFQQAIDLGYTHVVYEAENSMAGAQLFYNERLTDRQAALKSNNATNAVAFENGRVAVSMDITGLANSKADFIYLAGVEKGKLLSISLVFTTNPITTAKVSVNGTETVKQRVLVGETFDMTKFSVTLNGAKIDDIKWTLNGDNVDMTNKALELPEGIHLLKGSINGATGRGSAICQLSVVRPLESGEILGELATQEKYDLMWQSGGSTVINTSGIQAESQLSLSAMAIMKAREDGYNYLEVTVNARDGWAGIDLCPNSTQAVKASYSTFDGMSTFVIDLTNITQDDGYIRLMWVNQYTVILKHAQFIKTPVTDKVDYAHYGYCGDVGALTVTSGAIHSVNDIEELKSIYDVNTQIWKTFRVAKAGTIGIKKSIVEAAKASGYKKITLTVIGVNGATTVYYNSQLSAGAINATAGKQSGFTKKHATITIDISNVANISGEWVYLAGVTNGWLVPATLYFAK